MNSTIPSSQMWGVTSCSAYLGRLWGDYQRLCTALLQFRGDKRSYMHSAYHGLRCLRQAVLCHESLRRALRQKDFDFDCARFLCPACVPNVREWT